MVECNFEPRSAGASCNVMNANRLAARRRRPIRIRRHDAIDGFSDDIDEFVDGRSDGIDAINFRVTVLRTGTGGSADPVILPDYNSHIRHGIAIWRAPQVYSRACRLV